MSITLGNWVSSGETNGNTISSAATVITSGRLLVGFANWEDVDGLSITSVSDTANQSWVLGPRISASPLHCQLFYCLRSKPHASDVITVRLTGTAFFYNFVVAEFYETTGEIKWLFDRETSNNAASGLTYTSPPVTVTATPSVAITSLATYTGQVFTHTGWTLVNQYRGGSEAVYQVPAAPGALSPNVSWDSNSNWLGRTVVFRQAPTGDVASTLEVAGGDYRFKSRGKRPAPFVPGMGR